MPGSHDSDECVQDPLVVSGTSRFGEFNVVNNGARNRLRNRRGGINADDRNDDFNPERVKVLSPVVF